MIRQNTSRKLLCEKLLYVVCKLESSRIYYSSKEMIAEIMLSIQLNFCTFMKNNMKNINILVGNGHLT